MNARTTWIGCAAAGIVAFLCSWLFGHIPGLVACGPTGGLGPIIAFEFVASPADVVALFGSEPCRSTLVAAQQSGLLLDGLGFIPAYTAFLILGAVALTGKRWLKLAMIAMFAVAGSFDQIEGYLLYRILADLPGTQGVIHILFWVVHLKFTLLAIGTTLLGALLIGARRNLIGFAAIPIWIGGLGALYGLGHMPNTTMMLGFAVAWVTLLLTAFTGVLRPSLFLPVPAAPPSAPARPSA